MDKWSKTCGLSTSSRPEHASRKMMVTNWGLICNVQKYSINRKGNETITKHNIVSRKFTAKSSPESRQTEPGKFCKRRSLELRNVEFRKLIVNDDEC